MRIVEPATACRLIRQIGAHEVATRGHLEHGATATERLLALKMVLAMRARAGCRRWRTLEAQVLVVRLQAKMGRVWRRWAHLMVVLVVAAVVVAVVVEALWVMELVMSISVEWRVWLLESLLRVLVLMVN